MVPSPHDAQKPVGSVKKGHNAAVERAKIKGHFRLYDLRHTAATLAVAAGVSVKVISDQLGHASISFTLERYSRVLPSIQDEAAARVERMLMGSFASIRSEPIDCALIPQPADPQMGDHSG